MACVVFLFCLGRSSLVIGRVCDCGRESEAMKKGVDWISLSTWGVCIWGWCVVNSCS